MLSLRIKSKSRTIAGLTLSDEGIAVALVRPGAARPELSVCRFYPCQASQRAEVLQQIVNDHKLAQIPVNLVLLPDEYQLIQVDAPEVPKQELAAALRWQIKDRIDFHVDDAVIEHLALPALHTSGKDQLLVVISRKLDIQNHVNLLNQCHCRLNTIDIAILAARNLLIPLTEPETSVGLLNLWDEFSRISVLSSHDVYINRTSSIGLNALQFLTDDHLADQTIIDSLAVELQRTFDYFERHSRQTAISTLFIIVNSAQSIRLDEWLQQRLGFDCVTLDIRKVVTIADDHSDHTVDNRCLMALGGALRSEH